MHLSADLIKKGNSNRIKDRPQVGTKLGDLYDEFLSKNFVYLTLPGKPIEYRNISTLRFRYDMKIISLGNGAYEFQGFIP